MESMQTLAMLLVNTLPLPLEDENNEMFLIEYHDTTLYYEGGYTTYAEIFKAGKHIEAWQRYDEIVKELKEEPRVYMGCTGRPSDKYSYFDKIALKRCKDDFHMTPIATIKEYPEFPKEPNA